MIRGVHHTNFSTPTLQRMLDFYHGLLGFEVVWTYEWEAGNTTVDTIVGLQDTSVTMAMLRAGNTHIEIMQYRHPQGREAPMDPPPCDHGLVHLCFDVTDIHSEYERLKKAGVRFVSEPTYFDRLYSLYGRDPDGNIFELQELLDEDHELQLPWLPGRGALAGA